MPHNVSDLKTYYDSQLLSIRCMVQGSVRIQWEAAKIFQRVLSIMNHYVHTGFRISNASYENKRDNVLGATCRDVSCLTSKHLESKVLGV